MQNLISAMHPFLCLILNALFQLFPYHRYNGLCPIVVCSQEYDPIGSRTDGQEYDSGISAKDDASEKHSRHGIMFALLEGDDGP